MVNRFNVRLQGLACFAFLAALLAIAAPDFFAPGHLSSFAHTASVIAVLALGATLVMTPGGIDLSVAAVASLCGIVAADLAAAGWPLPIALAAAVATGLLCGLANGALAAVARVPPFIVTLAMLVIARGAARLWAGPLPVTDLPDSFLALGTDSMGLPPAVMAATALAIAAHALVSRTDLCLPAPDADHAALTGHAQRWRLAAPYALCGGCAAVAGILISARHGMADPGAGQMLELYALAAVLVGGTGLVGGRGDAVGTLLGALAVGVLRHGLHLLDAQPGSEAVVAGVVLLAATAIDRARLPRSAPAQAASRPRRSAVVALAAGVAAIAAMVLAVSARQDRLERSADPAPRLALVLPAADAPASTALQAGAQREADRWGARLTVLAPAQGYAVAQQAQLLRSAVQMGAQAIVLAPAAASGLEPALRAAAEADIPVVIAGRHLSDKALTAAGVHVEATVAPDNVHGGQLVGHRLASAVGHSGEVAVITEPTKNDGHERRLGMLTAMAQYPKLRVVSTPAHATSGPSARRNPAAAATEAVLDAHPRLKGIFATDPSTALAVLDVLDRTGRASDIAVVGWGATPRTLDAIHAGRLLATAADFPEEMGRLAVMHAVALVVEGQPPPERVHTAVEVVDASSVAGFVDARSTPPRYRIGLVTQSSTNAYWLRLVAGAREAARRHGATLVWRAPQRTYDVERQFEIVTQLVHERVDGILLAPSGGRTMSMAVHAANRAGVPVLLVDSQLDVATLARLGAHVLGYVGSDNYAGGELAAEHALSLLPEGGKVALLKGAPDIWSTEERVRGFTDTLSQRPNLQIVAFTTAYSERGVARLVTSAWLEAHPDLDVIFAANGLMGLGAADALAAHVQAGRPLAGTPRVVAFDATEEVLQAIDGGHIAATVAQQPGEMGRRSVDTLIGFIEGRQGRVAVHIFTGTHVLTHRTAEPPRAPHAPSGEGAMKKR